MTTDTGRLREPPIPERLETVAWSDPRYLTESLVTRTSAESALRALQEERDKWHAAYNDMTADAMRFADELSAARAECERLRVDALCVMAYDGGDGISIERATQLNGPDRWAVRRLGDCLSKSGSWEWEPRPSERDDEFLSRCRFDTAAQAIDAARTSQGTPTP